MGVLWVCPEGDHTPSDWLLVIGGERGSERELLGQGAQPSMSHNLYPQGDSHKKPSPTQQGPTLHPAAVGMDVCTRHRSCAEQTES